jgi:hypothetical protein
MPSEPKCQEWIYLDWYDLNHPTKMPRSEFGELKCNGKCGDGSQCKPHSQEFDIPGDGLIKKEWCGCPEDRAEPTFCHGVRETYRSGGRIFVKFNCHGDCPGKVPRGETCREEHRPVDAPAGVERRYIVQCECLGHEQK